MGWNLRSSSNRSHARAEVHRNEQYCKKLQNFYNNANSRTFETEMFRARMLIFYYQGNSAIKVARVFKASRATVLRLSLQFEREGLIGLSDKPPRNRIRLASKEKEIIFEHLNSFKKLKIIELVDFIEEEFGKDYSSSTRPIQAILHQAGFSFDRRSAI
ncbi:MAG: hypothetical protein AAF063_28455, partial [Cyanobacteria bacterium J06643_5]